MTVSFHPAAQQEYSESVDYYEEREPGLGLDFSAEVASAIDRILAHPLAWPFIDEGIRRALLRRYPYGVLYAIAGDSVFILAVMHLHRSPGYWQSRTDPEQ
ncbi:MAG: type II toxin-antitoxin system RelE/ParE family toxin [Spirochaetaceae bacterium]|nr:MAG: type II toxin-antitoxin system RelE/ParE family toxin [Spirochaetaceae bacterium]